MSSTEPRYRTFTKRLDTTSAFSALYHQFWGRPFQIPSDRILTLNGLGAEDLSIDFGYELTSSPCLLYVREEYEKAYSNLMKLQEDRNRGVILTGSPGIGKSIFNLYALAKRFSEKNTTIFYRSDRDFYIFDSDGVFRVRGHMDMVARDLIPQNNCLPWCLYDSLERKEHDSLFINGSFLIFTTSPHVHRYKEWKKQRGIPRWWMNVWDYNELEQGLKLHSILLDSGTFVQYGPCFRDHIFQRPMRPECE
ncbi:hypothetical protein D9757_000983 [Collybiopsis confluens]|uniref:Uncharacterized protein n=1 Tax=Collybiopsis confluens TaxID=2823264 RepID=A0A8H5I0B6_9AGAR|nr:hypothetical protein D9757_000983 [Collybiopsis confluens]